MGLEAGSVAFMSEEEEASLKEIGRIYQDMTDPEASVIVVVLGEAYRIDPRTLIGRLLKWNTKKIEWKARQ